MVQQATEPLPVIKSIFINITTAETPLAQFFAPSRQAVYSCGSGCALFTVTVSYIMKAANQRAARVLEGISMGNSASGIITNGVTISQVLANAGAASDQRYSGNTLDLDHDGVYEHSNEFVAIKNFSDAPVDISGWQIWTSASAAGTTGSAYHTFPPGTILAVDQELFVITDFTGTLPADVVEANGTGAQSFISSSNLLYDGAGGEIALVNTTDPANVEYVQFTMDTSPQDVTDYSGFPKNSDGTDATRVMGDPLGPRDSEDAQAGYISGDQRTYGVNQTANNGLSITYNPIDGEVGYINGGSTFPGSGTATQSHINLNGVTFFETLPDNNGGASRYDVDGDGTATNADQFTSFVNTTGGPIDISGYEIWAAPQGSTTYARYHTFASGTILQPGEKIYVVTEYTGDPSTRDENIVEANGHASPTNSSQYLNAATGEVAFLDPTTGNYIQFSLQTNPTNLLTQNPFPGTANMGTIRGTAEYGSPSNSDTYRYDHETGLVIEIDQTVSIAVACFAADTQIKTTNGEVEVCKLRVGDLVLTKDNGFQRIRWIASRRFDAIDLTLNPSVRPVRISARALGHDLPHTDLLVSPQHRLLVRSKIALNMFGEREVLVAAKQLLAVEGIDIADDVVSVEYWHLLFENHEIIWANGAESESLYVGKEALHSIGKESFDEIKRILPNIVEGEDNYLPDESRMLLTGRQARRLAERHFKNAKPLYDMFLET